MSRSLKGAFVGAAIGLIASFYVANVYMEQAINNCGPKKRNPAPEYISCVEKVTDKRGDIFAGMAAATIAGAGIGTIVARRRSETDQDGQKPPAP